MHKCKNQSLFFLQVNVSLLKQLSLASGLSLEHLPTTPLCLNISTETPNPSSHDSQIFLLNHFFGNFSLAIYFPHYPEELCSDSLRAENHPPLIFQLQLHRDASVPIYSHKSCAVVYSSWPWWPESKALSLDIPEAGIKGMAGGRAAVPRAMGSILLGREKGSRAPSCPAAPL